MFLINISSRKSKKDPGDMLSFPQLCNMDITINGDNQALEAQGENSGEVNEINASRDTAQQDHAVCNWGEI
jgi:hypothetical protein